jgi:hypothetical protein
MIQLAGGRHFPRLNMALVLASLWGGLALAAAIYDIGRWLSAW